MPLQSAFAFNANELFTSLGNMIISQWVASDNVSKGGKSLLNVFKTDGSMYGDSKFFYATDALKSVEWTQDSVDALNVLATHRPADPKVQKIVLNKFRQIQLTTDSVLSKRAWSDEGTFSTFTTVLIGWMGDTKYLYDESIINCVIGTSKATSGRQNQSVTLETGASAKADVEAQNRINAQLIAKKAADIITDLTSVRNAKFYNDYGFRRKYRKDQFITVWNADALNKITKIDLPTIFHKDGLMDKFEEEILPSRYFGDLLDSTLAAASVYDATNNPTGMFTKNGNNYTIVNTGSTANKVKSLIETDYTVSNVTTHVFPGDTIPVGAVLTITSSTVPFAYIENEDKICVVMHKRSVPYMSAFEVGTSFFNPKSLTENHYLTFGHNTLEYLKNYPFIVVKAI